VQKRGTRASFSLKNKFDKFHDCNWKLLKEHAQKIL
jgi:hypothetical protein